VQTEARIAAQGRTMGKIRNAELGDCDRQESSHE